MTEFHVAEAGIRQLQARYIDAVWRKDLVAFGDCFAEDAEWRLAGRILQGRAACVALLAEFIDHHERVLVALPTPILEVGNGTATGRTYMTEENIFWDRRPGFTIGVYYDRFVDQGDRWRFAYHHFILYYMGRADMSGRFFEAADYGPPGGMPGPNDPSTPSAAEIFQDD